MKPRLHVATTYSHPEGVSVHTQVIEFEDIHKMQKAIDRFKEKKEHVFGIHYQFIVL